MGKVVFETNNAIFKFSGKEANHIIGSDQMIVIPADHRYFGYVALDIIERGKGSITCKACSKTYKADQLKAVKVGHGKSPIGINQKQKGGTRLFGNKKNPSLFGGKGYECPAGHMLISMETWRT